MVWIIDTKKYAGVLAMLAGINNVVHVSKGLLRVSHPSRTGYAELKVPELTDDVDAMFDFSGLISMFSSKACDEVIFSPKAHMAMFRRPYVFKKNIEQVEIEEETAAIAEARDLPTRVRNAVVEGNSGVYEDMVDGVKYDTVIILIDNVIFSDMAKQLGCPRTLLKLDFDSKSMTLTNGEGQQAKYPKRKDEVFPSVPISISLSMETQPLVFNSMMGEKSMVYIVNEKFIMVEAAAGLFTFICAAWEAGYQADFEAPKM